jgi:hypothetical protein
MHKKPIAKDPLIAGFPLRCSEEMGDMRALTSRHPDEDPVRPRASGDIDETGASQCVLVLADVRRPIDSDRQIDHGLGRQPGDSGRPDVLDEPILTGGLPDICGSSAELLRPA